MKVYRPIFSLIALVIYSHVVLAQPTTKNNYTGSWISPASWVNSVQPDPLTTSIDDPINIDGYITRTGDLHFKNIGNNSLFITIRDTLVVTGSMTFENNSISLKVETGGLLVVFGSFTANNQVNLANGGSMVVVGNLALNGGNSTYVNNGGALYVDGTVSGSTTASNLAKPSENLDGSPKPGEQQLYSFITGGGTTTLPIKLGYFGGVLKNQMVGLTWQTLSEENFDYFEVQRSVNGAAFEVIGTVKGSGFTSDPQQYSFDDRLPNTGFNYYRLNAIDYDGTSELFQVISVEVKPDFTAVRMYPNPNSGESFSLAIPATLQGNIFNLVVSDLNGRVLLEQKEIESNVHASFHSKLAPGIYMVSLQTLSYTSTLRLLVN